MPEFVQYTNCMKDTVYCEEENSYLDVGKLGFLVSESNLNYYKRFGHGYKSINLVGQIENFDKE